MSTFYDSSFNGPSACISPWTKVSGGHISPPFHSHLMAIRGDVTLGSLHDGAQLSFNTQCGQCWCCGHMCLAGTAASFLYLALPNILLWSILCKTVGLPSSTGESERTARRQFHSPTLRCFRGRLCEVAAGRGPLKQSRWPESNWTLPLRSVGVAPSLGRFWLVFTALKLRYVLRRHIILSDSDGNQGVLDCFTVYPGLGGSAKWFYVTCRDGS